MDWEIERVTDLTVQDNPGQITVVDSSAPSGSLLAFIAAALRDPSFDIAKMEGLFALQERAMAKHAEMEYNRAMARLQAKLPRIEKRGKIAFGAGAKAQSTPYVKFEHIFDAIAHLLKEEGFSFRFGTAAIDKGILISATLSHVGGHSEKESMPLPFDTSGSKNSIQAVGSSLSYGKRYLVFAMLNLIAEGEDDDANAITFIDERQMSNIIDLQAELGWDKKPTVQKKFLEFMKVEALGEILKKDYEKALLALKESLDKAKEVAK